MFTNQAVFVIETGRAVRHYCASNPGDIHHPDSFAFETTGEAAQRHSSGQFCAESVTRALPMMAVTNAPSGLNDLIWEGCNAK